MLLEIGTEDGVWEFSVNGTVRHKGRTLGHIDNDGDYVPREIPDEDEVRDGLAFSLGDDWDDDYEVPDIWVKFLGGQAEVERAIRLGDDDDDDDDDDAPDPLTELLDNAGEWAHGGDSERAAAAWRDAGFDAEAVPAWLEARTFDAPSAALLEQTGISPDQAARVSGEGEGAGAYVDSYGYKVSNADLTADEALELIEAAELL